MAATSTTADYWQPRGWELFYEASSDQLTNSNTAIVPQGAGQLQLGQLPGNCHLLPEWWVGRASR